MTRPVPSTACTGLAIAASQRSETSSAMVSTCRKQEKTSRGQCCTPSHSCGSLRHSWSRNIGTTTHARARIQGPVKRAAIHGHRRCATHLPMLDRIDTRREDTHDSIDCHRDARAMRRDLALKSEPGPGPGGDGEQAPTAADDDDDDEDEEELPDASALGLAAAEDDDDDDDAISGFLREPTEGGVALTGPGSLLLECLSSSSLSPVPTAVFSAATQHTPVRFFQRRRWPCQQRARDKDALCLAAMPGEGRASARAPSRVAIGRRPEE